MKIILTFTLISTFFLNCIPNNRDPIIGTYKFRGMGGTGHILTLHKDNDLEFLNWIDVGGSWHGFHGKYKMSSDTIFLKIIMPINQVTHTVRIDTLLIRKIYEDILILVPRYNINDFDKSMVDHENLKNWIVYKTIDLKPYIGNFCFLRIGDKITNEILDHRDIEWETPISRNNKEVPYPQKPKMPVYNFLEDST